MRADGDERSPRGPAGPAGSPCTGTGAGPVVAGRCRCHAPGVAARGVIVDDHAPFRSLARRLLVAGGFLGGGEAGDRAGGPAAARDLAPDIVLLDVQLPDLDGFTLAEELTGRQG